MLDMNSFGVCLPLVRGGALCSGTVIFPSKSWEFCWLPLLLIGFVKTRVPFKFRGASFLKLFEVSIVISPFRAFELV